MTKKTTEKPTHTKGPWRVSGQMVEGNGIYVAACDASVDWRANARLIAAAPEMKAAIEAILKWDHDNMGIAVNTEGAVVLSMLQAALLKAEGK